MWGSIDRADFPGASNDCQRGRPLPDFQNGLFPRLRHAKQRAVAEQGSANGAGGRTAGLGVTRILHAAAKEHLVFQRTAAGHVLEVSGRTGIADSYGSSDSVPFYERYYLGGLYSLRGYEYRSVSPRDPGYDEPVGGDTFWFGSVEYSIPIVSQVRFAVFYDIGDVQADPFTYDFGTTRTTGASGCASTCLSARCDLTTASRSITTTDTQWIRRVSVRVGVHPGILVWIAAGPLFWFDYSLI